MIVPFATLLKERTPAMLPTIIMHACAQKNGRTHPCHCHHNGANVPYCRPVFLQESPVAWRASSPQSQQCRMSRAVAALLPCTSAPLLAFQTAALCRSCAHSGAPKGSAAPRCNHPALRRARACYIQKVPQPSFTIIRRCCVVHAFAASRKLCRPPWLSTSAAALSSCSVHLRQKFQSFSISPPSAPLRRACAHYTCSRKFRRPPLLSMRESSLQAR